MQHTDKAPPMPQPAFACNRLLVILAAILSMTLSACGSGSDIAGGDLPPAPAGSIAPTATAATSALPQGHWVSSGYAPGYTAVVVPVAADAVAPLADTVWALAQDTSTLIKLKINGGAQAAGTVSGNTYTLGTNNVTSVAPSSYNLQPTGSGQQMSLQIGPTTAMLLDRTDAMNTPLHIGQANGRWAASLNAMVVNWAVQGPNFSGTSTTGCTYSGQSSVVTTQSLYRMQFVETCASTVQSFNGIATMSPDNSRLTVVATNEQGTRAAALLFVRQP